MKKLYSLFALFSIWLCFSQTVLSQPETVSRTVQDPNIIILAPGFYANSHVGNLFVATIGSSNSNNNPVDSNAGYTNPSGTIGSNSFHDTQGNIEVNAGGQLQFSLPIALPPGVKSVAPQINLTYSSDGGNGIAGYGWNISGITAISRISKTVLTDGEVRGVQLDYSDYYSFNGQRLILKSGEYGKDGAEYITEKYSNFKIKSIGRAYDILAPLDGPAYFEVSFEDGSRAWYGGFPNDNSITGNPGRTKMEYNIVKWMDLQGNYISYNYSQTSNITSNNVAAISSIQWGGNEKFNQPHFNEIKFDYNTRDFREQSYVNNVSFIQDRILKYITVNSNGNQFKKYEIEHKKIGSNYNFVDKITEFNSTNQKGNPIVFENTIDSEVKKIIKEESRFDDIYGENVLSGDLNGDGKIDFIKEKKIMLGRLDGNNQIYNLDIEGKPLATGSYLKNGVLLNKQALFTFVSLYSQKKIRINVYEFNDNNTTSLLKSNEYDISQFSYITDETPPPPPVYEDGTKCPGNMDEEGTWYCYPINYRYDFDIKAKEADFDGDGLSDLLLTLNQLQKTDKWVWENQGMWEIDGEVILRERELELFLNFNEGITVSTFPKISTLGDFNGNGKTDVVEIKDNNINVYELDSAKQFVKLFSTVKESFNEVLYIGDFNGDGKTDLLAPLGNDSSDWRMYISTGNGFHKEFYSNLFLYKPYNQGPPRKNRQTVQTYSTTDLNKDGKSDFVIFESQVWFRDGWSDWNNPDSSYGFNYLRNEGVDVNGKPIFANIYSILPQELNFEGESLNYSMYGEHYIPLFGNFRIAQLNTDFLIIHKTKLIIWDLGNKLNKVSKIKSITQGGLKTEIEYSPLTSSSSVYKSYYNSNPLIYPYINISEDLNYEVVSRVKQGNRKQDFRYRDLIGHLQGKGGVGFRQTARSNFYTDTFLNTKIWSGSEMNPLNESLPIKEWSIKTNDESNIFPSDISLLNNQLLTLKEYEYKVDKLLNGIKVDSFSNSDKAKIVTAINPHIITFKDFLKDIKSVQIVESYDNLYYPLKSVTYINDGFAIKTTEAAYYEPIINNSLYNVGRPQWKRETIQAYGDTKSNEEEFFFTGNLLNKKRTYNSDKSEYIQEDYVYDGYGNVIEKIINNPLNKDEVKASTSKSKFDEKGRFVIEKEDNFGLKTYLTYNDLGLLLMQIDPIGNKLINTYDTWGKILSSKTNLRGVTTFTYEKLSNNDSKITEYSADGDQTIKYTNNLGQNYKITSKGFNQDSFVSVNVNFDELGRKIGESEPYFGSSPSKWNTTEYDDYSRVIKKTVFTGKIVTITYNKRTITSTETNANNRFKTQVYDPLNNLTSATDLGGTITYKYTANGENVEASYGANKVSITYDNWGNRSEFYDPSNGHYRYKYNGYGQETEIESPLGKKYFYYNEKGDLYRQVEQSNDNTSTNKIINFIYDRFGRITKKTGTSNGVPYESFINYDANGRVISSGEISNSRTYYNNNIKYDDKGRIISYDKGLYSSGVTTVATLENIYSSWNGDLYQLKDRKNNNVLWELSETNSKGQVLKSKLGVVNIENVYDSNNFLDYVNHKNVTNSTILYIDYSFNAIKNELNSRNTGGSLNILESFSYDENNRLTSWTNPITGNLAKNVYDSKGRIIENDQIGIIKFNDSQSIYRATDVTLNEEGEKNYTNNLILSVSYSENNDPIFINGEKGDVSFDYGLSSMRQRVNYGGNFELGKTGKYTKFYSDDGSFEVVQDNATGKEKYILYIGGNAYESNIVFIKNYNESIASYKFLHKDYIGSILAISDEIGNILEQCHYDAWGNITHFKINGLDKDVSKFNEFAILDRGYTSHEHFIEVGIIHMNGRLYDPILRRFLNADENIQDPENTQIYNKYGYVINNPLMYNDPNGEFIWWLPAAVAIFSQTVQSYYMNQPLSIEGLAVSLVTSYLSAGMGYGVGEIFKTAEILVKVPFLLDTVHGISGAIQSVVQGGDFKSGFLSGFFGSIAGSTSQAFFGKNLASSMISGFVLGGVGAEIVGGNFWVGAVTGLGASVFNHYAHNDEYNNKIRSSLENPDGIPEKKMSSVENVKKQVKGLFTKDMSAADKSSMVQEEITNLNSKMDGTTSAKYNESNGGILSKITIKYNNGAFKTNYSLAKTILHEFYHAADYLSNRWSLQYYNLKWKSKLIGDKLDNAMTDWAENRAYDFIFKMGVPESIYNKKDYY